MLTPIVCPFAYDAGRADRVDLCGRGRDLSPRRRTVVVTGSASGMGSALFERLDRAGMRVVGVDRAGAEVNADLRSDEGRDQAVEAASELCGGRLDGLVTCAGLGPQERATGDIVRVNFFGTIVIADRLLPLLAKGEAPAAVLFASNAASLTPLHHALLEELLHHEEEAAVKLAEGLDGITVYGMTKLALVRELRRRAGKWAAEGVRINAVAPGPVETPMLEGIMADPTVGPLVEALPVPLGRRASPHEVAGAAAFLLDPANSYVHGAVLFVDGGSDAELRPDAI
jgi:NAD(P)-dependent dehydrogenase (short-subunit alcohol dehydrogenase family)